MITLLSFLSVLGISLCEITAESVNSIRKSNYPPPCDSEIYCTGPLLHTVQMAGIYKDSKKFVDDKLRTSPRSVLDNFDAFMNSVSYKPTQNQTRKFVEENFVDGTMDLDPWTPDDWNPSPSFIDRIQDSNLKEYAHQLNDIWKILGRRIDLDVQHHEDEYSLIFVPNPFMVPGGRFAEFYYWDQYWILKGMLICEMHDSVKAMIENFLMMVRNFGFVPNGGRIYYQRTQPPLLISMVKDYLDATQNFKFLRKHLPTLDKEFHFWMKNRTVVIHKDGRSYRLARYNNERTGPRPESYREDFELAEQFKTTEEQDEIYINLKSGAESGWDFSSRWFIPDDPNTVGTLRDIKTRHIIPVDLNAFLYNNARILAGFHRKLGQLQYASYYDGVAMTWRKAINDLLWDEELGCWFDFDLRKKMRRTEFYPSNVTPLWANITVKTSHLPKEKCHHGNQEKDDTADRVVAYLKNSGALSFPGGVPASMEHTGEQWDFPNGWAPLQHLVVEALRHGNTSESQSLAFSLAQRWVYNNYLTFKNSNNTMFEKYDVQSVGSPGGGGEYDVVAGFGWSNGVMFDFLNTFGESLKSSP